MSEVRECPHVRSRECPHVRGRECPHVRSTTITNHHHHHHHEPPSPPQRQRHMLDLFVCVGLVCFLVLFLFFRTTFPLYGGGAGAVVARSYLQSARWHLTSILGLPSAVVATVVVKRLFVFEATAVVPLRRPRSYHGCLSDATEVAIAFVFDRAVRHDSGRVRVGWGAGVGH